VNTTLKLDANDPGTPATASVTVTVTVKVASPGWTGSFNYLKSAAIFTNANGNLVLGYGDSTHPGASWASIAPAAAGQVSTVQTIVMGDNSRTTDGVHYVGFVSPTTGASAPFPVDDVSASSPSPFYGNSFDSPYFVMGNSNTTTLSINFSDSVMYEPPGGIWVPEGYFTWSVYATANSGSPNTLGAKTISPGHPTVNHNSWPTWNDVSGNYQGIKQG